MKWRWAKDSWFSKGGLIIRFDKIEHAVLFFIGFWVLLIIGIPINWSLVFLLALGILWEIKDALVPFEKYGKLGGDGFSWRDIMADIVGLAIALILKMFTF